ncbi:acyl-CoA dehydrogenase family protein [Natronogracilivirga saccharolytica]|uniref:Acyl-CoA/acyl-ACP dehydrogenase n=1 Tax=Natronogracilivirga saccharolytica TaxID=2812953 RepID=A0A8J7RKW7_9BACT|nr:acyl-CoA dehydrogenase family protein [Natronogracilivirga saccharolytica]MBP3193585.1 acyl-CoA/acyl-ACP dehydrogenase [Natronogracilivirga saccharolytica]
MNNNQDSSFSRFIKEYENVLHRVFRDSQNHKKVSLHRSIPPMLMRDIMQCKPLNVFIGKEHGGFGGNVSQCLKMLEASSYESLPLSLMMGINGALFIQPVSRYADKKVAKDVLWQFVNDQAMGGLMITEPGYGSDALHMQTAYQEAQNGYRIKGTKHWAGLTGWADYWLLTARKRKKDGTLARDIDFFIHDNRNSGIEVEEYFENLGLYMLPYGRNSIDVTVPADYKLDSGSTGIKLMLDMLHRSRMQFPGMAMGFLRRIADDALTHVTNRSVGGKSLFSYDQVKERMVRLQSWFTSCSAMCAYTSAHAPISKNLSTEDIPANAIKSIVTDMMQDAAQSFLQLTGAQGYKLDHMAGRGIIDSRPFQIFEGSNDILYQQIAESFIKRMRKAKISVLYDYLKSYELTQKASEYLEKDTNISVSADMAQRKQVVLGKMLGYVVTMNMVLDLGEKGFNNELIGNTLNVLSVEIKKFLNVLHELPESFPSEDIESSANWADFTS